MKKISCCIILLLCSLGIYSQSTPKLDSLKRVLAKLPKEGASFPGDTLRVRVLCEMGDKIVHIKNDSIAIFLKKVLATSVKSQYKVGILKANLLLAQYYTFQPVRASEYLFKALAISEDLKSNRDILQLTNLIAENYFSLDEYDNAIKYFKRYSSLCKTLSTPENYLLSLNSVGVMFLLKKDYKSALNYFYQCEQYNEVVKSAKVKTSTLINIAKVQIALGDYDNSIKRLKNAMLINDGYNDRISFSANEIVQIYLAKNKLDKALFYAKMAYNHRSQSDLNNIAYVNKALYEVYKRMGRADLAMKYLEQYTSTKLSQDSIKNSQLNRFMILDYKSEKQFQEITDLSQSILLEENKNRLFLVGLCFAAAIIIIIFLFYNSLRKKNKEIAFQKNAIQELNNSLEIKVHNRTQELSKANEELIRKNEEIIVALVEGQTLERKRVAIELHDNLGSMLSAIKWRLEALNSGKLSEKEQQIYANIQNMVHSAYSEVRLISHNMLPNVLKERGIVGALEKLAEDINVSEKMSISLFIDENISLSKKIELELYSICMELVNNIIKHAQATEILITLKTFQETIYFNVKDNGKGMDLLNNNNGMGLKTLQERVRSINGEISFDSESEKGTLVKISIPIEVNNLTSIGS